MTDRLIAAVRRALPVAAPLVLSACAQLMGDSGAGTTIRPPLIESRYSVSEVNSVGGWMPVEVHGGPPNGASSEEVVAAMRMPHHFSVHEVVHRFADKGVAGVFVV